MSAEAIDFHGLPAIRWSSDGASAIATLQGAQVVSWVPEGREEALFLSERSPFQPGRAIRGGIPVCFPQFADRGPLSQHGFARLAQWRFSGEKQMPGRSGVGFELEDSPWSRESWPHAFRAALFVMLSADTLELRLCVANPGDAAFAFTAALHTYLRVDDASRASIEGLQGVRYLTRGEKSLAVEERRHVGAAEPIDRIYFSPPSATRVRDAGRHFEIEQTGFTDTVIWNPGASRTAQMQDMAPDAWRRMLCVEAAAIEPAVELPGSGAWSGTQVIRCVGVPI